MPRAFIFPPPRGWQRRSPDQIYARILEKFTHHVHFKQHFRLYKLKRPENFKYLFLCARFQGNLKVFSKEEKIDGSRLLPEANHTSRCFINIHESHSPLCKIHVSHINVGLNQASRVHLCYPPKTISSEDVSHSGNSV